MKPEEYFPRPIKEKPGEEPFLPSFTNAVKSERPEKKMVKRICAWCQKEMGEIEAEGGEVTHGMCEKCAEEFKKDMPPEPSEKK